jgi:uncharacterized protein YbjQ (UPF0145 family)
MKCHYCKAELTGGRLALLGTAMFGADEPACDACRKNRSEEQTRRADDDAIKKREFEARIRAVVLTTTPTIEGHRVTAYLGIESVEVVIGTGAFTELGGDWADFLGRRSTGFEAKLQNAKNAASYLLKRIAAEKGADAVIGVDLDYTEFSSNRTGVILNGTLVKVEPISIGSPTSDRLAVYGPRTGK